MRRSLRLIAGMLGLLLLAYTVWRADPAMLLKSIGGMGWGVILVIALSGVSHLVKTSAWRLTLPDEKRKVSFVRMLGLRLGSEAAGQLGSPGQVLGETLRVSLLASTLPVVSGITSVTLDRALFLISGAIVSTAGLIVLVVCLPLPHALSLCARMFSFVLLGVIVVTPLAVRKRWGMFSGSARMLGRVRYFRQWAKRKRSLIHSVEDKRLDFYRTP
jgi:hypothetical protein